MIAFRTEFRVRQFFCLALIAVLISACGKDFVIYDQSGERYEVTKDDGDVIVHLDERDLRIEMDTLTHVYRGNGQNFFVMGIK